MKPASIDLLACPICHGKLSLQDTQTNGAINSGSLLCPSCQVTYPIQNGMPRFVKEDELIGLNKTFAHLYDWFSLIYVAFSKVGFLLLGTTDSRARREVLSRLEPNGGKVLEVSIGPGNNLPYLLNTPEVGEVYGLDISIGQLKRCNSLVQRKLWPVDLFLGNAEDLPFMDESFNSVFHIGGINFFSNPQKAIAEMIRVAKPGTRIIICDENETGARWYEKFLPGFKAAFKGQRTSIVAPIELVPKTMLDIKLGNIWNRFMYCLEFRKPYSTN